MITGSSKSPPASPRLQAVTLPMKLTKRKASGDLPHTDKRPRKTMEELKNEIEGKLEKLSGEKLEIFLDNMCGFTALQSKEEVTKEDAIQFIKKCEDNLALKCIDFYLTHCSEKKNPLFNIAETLLTNIERQRDFVERVMLELDNPNQLSFILEEQKEIPKYYNPSTGELSNQYNNNYYDFTQITAMVVVLNRATTNPKNQLMASLAEKISKDIKRFFPVKTACVLRGFYHAFADYTLEHTDWDEGVHKDEPLIDNIISKMDRLLNGSTDKFHSLFEKTSNAHKELWENYDKDSGEDESYEKRRKDYTTEKIKLINYLDKLSDSP